MAALALVALGALLIVLSRSEAGKADDCVEADVLATSVCAELHDDPASLLLTIGIVVIIATVVLAGVAAFLRRREAAQASGADADRAEVVAAEEESGDAPVRVCPVCSAQSRTHSQTCPHCGASFIRSRRIRAKRAVAGASKATIVAAIVSALLILVAAGGAYAALDYTSDKEDEEETLTEEEQEAIAEQEAQEAAEQAAEEERLERKLRQSLVKDLEESITKDAQKESEREFSLIDGPILDTQCDPKGGQIDTDATTQSFSCLAITRFIGTRARGYRYAAEVNYDEFSYRWRLGGGGI